MDDSVWRQNGVARLSFNGAHPDSKIELLNSGKTLDNATPVSKLCVSMIATTLETPECFPQKAAEPMFEETLLKSSQQMDVDTHLSPSDKNMDTVFQTPRNSSSCNFEGTPMETPLNTPVTSRSMAVETPLCIALGKDNALKNVNSTPRRNPRRSCIDKFTAKELEEKQLRQVCRPSVLKGTFSKSNLSKPKIIMSQYDNKLSDDEDNYLSPDVLSKKDCPLQEEGISDITCSRESLFCESRNNSILNNSLNRKFSFHINKGPKNIVSSEPRCSKKSESGTFSARRLSFSAKKRGNKQKKEIPEYDPDNDIFAQGVMPIQFNVDILKQEIGKYLATSDVSSPCSNKSRSCSALNEIVTPVRNASPSPTRKKQSRKVTPSSSEKLKRTVSAPNVLIATKTEPKLNTKGTSEGRIKALLHAREIIKNIRERTKNIFNIPNEGAKSTSHAESVPTNHKLCGGSLLSDCNEVPTSGNSGRPARKESINQQINNSFEDSDLPPTQPFESFILRGVTAYVEVISKNENISAGVRTELVKLGANVVTSFTKNVPVTHVVFNDGHISTYKKAKKRNIPLVSVLWIEKCRKVGRKVNESLFPPYQLERYESPSIVKELKKRKIMRFYSDEKPRPSPRKKKEGPKCATVLPLIETPPEKSAVNKSTRKSKWIDEVAGDNNMVRLLVNMTGINHNEFKDLMNRPPTPDSDLELDQNSPLPVRLLRKLAQNLPKNNALNDDISKKDEINGIPQTTNHSFENSFVQKLNEVLESGKEEVPNNGIEKAKSIKSVSMHTIESPHQESQADCSKSQNISQRKKVSKRKLLTSIEETIVMSSDVENVDTEKTIIENPHCHTPKRLIKESIGKKRKSDNVQGEQSKTILKSEVKTEDQIDLGSNTASNSGVSIRRSRRSSIYFVKTKPRCPSPIAEKPGLVCTLLHSTDLDLITTTVEKLGLFVVEKNVTSRTTHIITGSPRRTMKVLKGMARGCWIVGQEWVLKSLEASKWLDEEEFELTTFSPAVQKYRLEKLSFGGIFKPDIFSNCGRIFISSKCNAPRGDLVELILLCGGKVTSRASNAEIVVGKNYPDLICVTDLWILDSVQYYCCKSFDSYLCS